MAFVMIRVDLPNDSVAQANTLVENSSKPHEGVVQLRNLCEAILAGAKEGEVAVALRDTTQSITAAGGGSSATYNLK